MSERRRRALGLWGCAAALSSLVGAVPGQVDLREWPCDPIAAIRARGLDGVPTEADTRTVTIVDENGVASAGADVVALRREDIDHDEGAVLLWGFLFGGAGQGQYVMIASRRGLRLRSDEQGRVRVPAATGVLVAFTDAALVVASSPGARVHLQPTIERKVEVVDHRGRPVRGVAVAFGRPGALLARSRTCADGRARIRVLQRLVSEGESFVEAGCVGARRIREPVPEASSVSGAKVGLLRLQLPPFGRVEIAVDDEPLRSVMLAGLPSTEATFETPPRWPATGGAPGVAIFEHVALGETFELTLQSARGGACELSIEGPSAEAEVRRHEVSFDQRTLQFSGRLFGTDGQPIASRQLWLWTEDARRRSLDQPSSDAQGHFRHVVDAADYAGSELRLEIRLADHRDAAAPLPAAVVMLDGARRGEIALGELRLELEPVVLSGRVLDGLGRPVGGIELSVPPSRRSGFGGEGQRVPTDAEGRFEVREAQAGDVELSVSSAARDWVVVGADRFRVGSRDVTVEVAPLQQLEVAFERADAARWLHVELLQAGRVRGVMRAEAGGGAVTFEALPPGRYDVVARLGAVVVATVEGVEVGPARAVDERLAKVRWTENVEFVPVRVLGPDGAPLRGSVWLGHEQGRATEVPTSDDGSVLAVRMPGQVLVAGAADRRLVELKAGPGAQEVRLPPAARLRLEAPGGVEMPTECRVRLLHEWDHLGVLEPQYVWQPDQPIACAPRARGAVVVQLLALGRTGFEVFHDEVIELPADDRVCEVVLAIDPESIAAFLRRR